MNLLQTSFLNGIAVLVRMLTLLGINKILAVYVGPTGYALIGQFQNGVQMLTTFSSCAINTGVTKFTAEHSGNSDYLRRLWQTSSTIAISGTFICSFIVFIIRDHLAAHLLRDPSLSVVFTWFALANIFFVLNTLLMSVLNGKKEIKKYVVCNISGSFSALIFTVFMTKSFGVLGALIALGVYQSVSFVVTLGVSFRSEWFRNFKFFGRIDWGIAQGLFHFTLMALASAICVPVSQMLVRSYLSERLSLTSAGQWEAVNRMSSAYLMFVTSTLTVYFLPRLSELKTQIEIRQEIKACLKVLVPFVLMASISIFFLRDQVIRILFSNDFLAIDELMFLQLTGDAIKIVSWILGFVILSKGMSFEFILSEVMFSFTFYGLVLILVPQMGLLGTAAAHVINYLLYLLFVFYLLKRKNVI